MVRTQRQRRGGAEAGWWGGPVVSVAPPACHGARGLDRASEVAARPHHRGGAEVARYVSLAALLFPQHDTLPDVLTAQVWAMPADTDVAVPRSAGMAVRPRLPDPQHDTLPDVLTAQVWASPADTTVTGPRSPGTVLRPSFWAPQHVTLPETSTAHE